MLKINNLNDVFQIEKLPLEQYLSGEQTTYAIIRRAAEQFPDRTALIFLPPGDPLADLTEQPTKCVYSYRELFAGIQQTINRLYYLGVRKGDVVSYLLPNIVENYFILYAAQAVGIANPISPILPPDQIITLLQNAESKILITMNAQRIQPHCPKLETIITVDDLSNLQPQPIPPLEWNAAQINPEAVCAYFHTSGTTGTPKLAKHTHLGNAYMAWAMGILTEYAQPATVVLSGLPMFHVGAPMVSGLAAFAHGATVVVMSPLGWMDSQVIANFWKIVEKYQGTTTVALPLIFHALNQVPVNGADIRSLRHAISGMAVTEHDFTQFKNQTGVKIANLWGQTEATAIGTFNPAVDIDDPHFGSMGIRLPFEQVTVRRFNAQGEYLRDCAIGEAGVLCIAGPHVPGYKHQDWLNTGDWVQQDAEGYFTFLGRDEDFIQHGDQSVCLLDIEKLACAHPGVAEAAAIGTIVYCTLEPNAQLTAEQLQNWLKNHRELSVHGLSLHVIVCPALPKNGMGKTLKYLLPKPIESK